MSKREKILYRGIWNKYQREYHYAQSKEYKQVCCSKLLNLEKVLEEITCGRLNQKVFDCWTRNINYYTEVTQ